MNNNSDNNNNNQIGSTPPPDFNTIFGIPPESEPQPNEPTETLEPVQAPETLEPSQSQNQFFQTTPNDNNQSTNNEVLSQPIETPNNNPITPTELNNQSIPDNNLTPETPNTIDYQNNYIDDDILLKSFIGNNYEKITTKSFNIAAFFFTALYMFYRKMFLYGLLLIIISTILSFIFKSSFISLIICVLVGLFINKIYISFAKNKIAKIKASHPLSSSEELRALCTKKGGTSIGTVILGILIQTVIGIISILVLVLIGFGNILKDFTNLPDWNVTFEKDNQNQEEGNLVEDITIDNYMCYEKDCTLTIVDKNNNSTEYTSKSIDTEYLRLLEHYKDYIKINIYYSEKNITSIKTYTKDNNEDISNIKDEESLRKKLGLYTLGTYTENLTLTSIGTPGFGVKDDYSYTYSSYKFTDSKNNNYEMKYINPPSTLNLKEGQSYKVTFEVVEGTFEYEYNIKSIQ